MKKAFCILTAVVLAVMFITGAFGLRPVIVKNRLILVETAATSAQRARGLMGRKHLGKDRGMLFVFEQPDRYAFWMKNTQLPLSIAFIGPDKKITDIYRMAPLLEDRRYRPRCPAGWALEMNQGWFAENGIESGDRIWFSP